MCRPLTGAWIETHKTDHRQPGDRRPLTGAWIETTSPWVLRQASGSRRPLTGAWIETAVLSILGPLRPGRPLTGAWIETRRASIRRIDHTAMRRPLTGAWIETRLAEAPPQLANRPGVASPPHGGVD